MVQRLVEICDVEVTRRGLVARFLISVHSVAQGSVAPVTSFDDAKSRQLINNGMCFRSMACIYDGLDLKVKFNASGSLKCAPEPNIAALEMLHLHTSAILVEKSLTATVAQPLGPRQIRRAYQGSGSGHLL